MAKKTSSTKKRAGSARKKAVPVRKDAGACGTAHYEPAYYYAGGKKILLTPATDVVAVDEARLRPARLPPAVRSALKVASRPLAEQIRLVEKSKLVESSHIEWKHAKLVDKRGDDRRPRPQKLINKKLSGSAFR